MTLVQVLQQYKNLLVNQINSTNGILSGPRVLRSESRVKMEYHQAQRIETVASIDRELARMPQHGEIRTD